MPPLRRILHFVKPYRKLAVLSLLLLTSLVFMDLAIPRLIQRIIDQGIKGRTTSPWSSRPPLSMLGISLLSTIIAIGNNNFSVRVGESVARDLREALFLKIQSFSYGNLDRFTTGQADGAPDQRRRRGQAPDADLAAHRHARAAADDRQPDPDDQRPARSWR